MFEVPHFSDNAVTFESSVSVAASPATNGTSLSWGLSDLDAASDVSVNLTGVSNTEWDNQTFLSMGDGDSRSVSVAGSAPPTGPNGSPSITVTASELEAATTAESKSGFFMVAGWDDNQDTYVNSEMKFTNAPDTASSITVDIEYTYANVDSNDGVYFDVYLVKEAPDGVYAEGTRVADNAKWMPEDGAGNLTIPFDSPQNLDAGANYTIEFVTTTTTQSGPNNQQAFALHIDNNKPQTDWSTKTTDGVSHGYPTHVYWGAKAASNVAVSADDGTEVTLGDFSQGESKSTNFPIGRDATQITTTTGSGSVAVELAVQEKTETVDPGVELGNCSESYPGTLAAGETATLTLNSSCLSETNELNVTVGGDLSADAPAPQVGVVAEHTAASNQTVDYAGDAWSERYNVSKTWADSRADARLVIPFASNVVSIRDVEFRTNSSSWTGTSNYELDGTTLTVNLGSVDAGETTHVRVNGSRVRVENGSITVTSPTLAGNSLDTEFRMDSWSESSYIAVGGSASGEFVHHLMSESWASPSESVVVEAGGKQRIYAPKAPEGGTARARTIPVEVQPENGVRVSVTDPTQPSFEVGPASASGDAYGVVYHDTVTGDTYRLVSETRDGYVIDEATASSPVTFTDPEDDTELLSVVKANETAGSAGGGGGGGGGGAARRRFGALEG
ncbi:hypothetical protein [Halobaculum litoreum]|uniref:hypothetical protein n=1 Tax=Halobaculum litoreum TaxID=3031998 RepID=UPI0024C3292F|nr:hypothetical protein [Halobaculum sp. DT92]